jgi:hypothetical protein
MRTNRFIGSFTRQLNIIILVLTNGSLQGKIGVTVKNKFIKYGGFTMKISANSS